MYVFIYLNLIPKFSIFKSLHSDFSIKFNLTLAESLKCNKIMRYSFKWKCFKTKNIALWVKMVFSIVFYKFCLFIKKTNVCWWYLIFFTSTRTNEMLSTIFSKYGFKTFVVKAFAKYYIQQQTIIGSKWMQSDEWFHWWNSNNWMMQNFQRIKKQILKYSKLNRFEFLKSMDQMAFFFQFAN